MHTLRILVLLVSSLEYVRSQECSKVDFPPLPFHYRADLQYNILHKERFLRGRCSFSGPDCGEAAPSLHGIPIHELGRSVGFSEVFDGRESREAAKITTMMEFVDHDSDEDAFVETFIWNREISGAKNFIEYLDFEGRLTCTVDNTTQDSVLDWLLGFDPSCVDTDTTHCPPPNIGSMLHTAGEYTWTDCPVYRGVATNLFETTMHIDAWNADVKLKYYWSDPSKWTGTSGSGISVPIACIMTGSAMDKDNKTVPIDDVIDFMTFFDTEPGVEEFAPVSDLVCRGREVQDMLPELPTYYEYGSELIFTHTHEDHGHKIVSPRNNWYDHEMQVARLDYKPIVLDHDHHTDPFEGMVGVQTDIQDFIAGISYEIDTNFGNCSIVPLKLDLAGDLDVENGRIHSPDPMRIFFTDQKFAYNGIHQERGIWMDYFATEIYFNGTVDESRKFDIVAALTSSQYLVQEDGAGGRLIPAQIVRYPANEYNSPEGRVTFNIFRFTKSRGEFQDYNILPCFEENHQMHIVVKMSWNMAMDFMAVHELQRFARTALKSTMEITPLRVQNIEFHLHSAESAYDLMFTLADAPPVEELGYELPIEATRPMEDCYNKLQAAVTAGTFVINIPANSGNNPENITSTASSIHQLQHRGDGGNAGPRVTYDKGYSSGDMAGLAFGMIFGGMLLAGVIYFFALRNNVRAGIPVMRGFDNPLTGLTNLVK